VAVVVDQADDRLASGDGVAFGDRLQQGAVLLRVVHLDQRVRTALAGIDQRRDAAERVNERVLRGRSAEVGG
jgi:hypothetical protein